MYAHDMLDHTDPVFVCCMYLESRHSNGIHLL